MDQRALALVVKAVFCNLSNCFEWINDKEANRVRSDPSNQGLTPGEIKRLTREHVRLNGPSCVEQLREVRENRRDQRDYWYRVIVAIDGFPDGLFVEMELLDDDPDVPIVVLLNAHPATR